MSRNSTIYTVWVVKECRMKRFRFCNAVKARRFTQKTDGNVWGVTREISTPSSRRAVEEHDYDAKHFRKHVREHRNLRRREADAKKRKEREKLRRRFFAWLAGKEIEE